jgi:NADPH-dependent curcumin reductase CurA
MPTETNRRVVLKRRPVGAPRPDDFELIESPLPRPGEGEIVCRTIYLSLDPYMRGRISGVKSYARGVDPGELMVGGTVGEVIESKHPAFAAGDLVAGYDGWQAYGLSKGVGVRKLDPARAPISTALGVLGMPGMTAYVGLLDIGRPKAGETVVVSAAAGSVGSIVGQIAKIKGCHVIGIAGGKDKCHWLTSDLGFDAAVDYKDGATYKALRAAAPKGIDVYFDNVGGDILEACIALMNNRGRIACCGAISQYDGVPSAHGPRGVPGLIVVKRLIMQGFIVMDYMDQSAAALADLQSWVASGKLKVQEDVIDGIENTPKALIGLLAGENRGKRMVRV